MPTNATTAAIIGALAPVLAAIVVLFKLNLTQDQQAELVSGLAAAVTAGAAIYASVVHASAAKTEQAKAYAAQTYPVLDGDNSVVPPKAG